MSSNYSPKGNVPSNPGGFGNVPKPNINMPTPKVTSTPTARVTSTPTPQVTSTPRATTPSIPNNPEFRGSYPPATKISTPVASKPTPVATPTPISTPTPVATPRTSTPSPVKTATTSMFGMGR